jgi:hypothetical protein
MSLIALTVKMESSFLALNTVVITKSYPPASLLMNLIIPTGTPSGR